MNNRELLEKFKINVAISNFEKEYEDEQNKKKSVYSLKNKEIWRNYVMKKRIIATTCLGVVLISGVAFATNIENIKNYFRGLGGGIDSAVEQGYVENPEMDYIQSNSTISNTVNKIIDNLNVEAKIKNFVMDDYNLSVEFNFKFDDEINKYVDLDNIHNIELKDLIVRDEENNILYAGSDEEAFNEYCNNYNLEYKFGEYNENYLNNGLNWFTSYHNKENRIVELMYNMYTDQYPKSKKLYFSFGKMDIIEENNETITELNGKWEIELDVPEKMYNRTTESYKVVGCDNDNFNVYSSTVSDTGFEIGVIISNIEKPEFPEELFEIQEYIWSKYKDEIDQTNANKEYQDIIMNNSEYKEKYFEFNYKSEPITLTKYKTPAVKYYEEKGKIITKEQIPSYVENSNGKKFECTLSPSRKQKCNWVSKDKYDFYETFAMTKYEATERIKVVLYYYGEPVTIELEKSK